LRVFRRVGVLSLWADSPANNQIHEKDTNMKITHRICTLCIPFAIALGLAFPSMTRAADQMKGGQMLIMKQIKTPAEAEALKPGDAITMVCAKCKSVMLHNLTTEKGHIKVMTVGSKHLCPGCDSTITTVGTGKGAHDVVKHSCDKCGDDSVFCCATKPGEGATKGMERR
jgi:hypothetical protein